MISWMQRHKKWLVITIWISTIAFVGAGFVGWGSYGYNSSQGVVAKVGSESITYSTFSQEYDAVYAQYKQRYGDKFNEEVAKQINLQSKVFKNLVNKYLLLNYAKDLGFYVSDEEVARELISYDAFKDENGTFSKDKYLTYLKTINKTPAYFEEYIAKEKLINKLQYSLSSLVSSDEGNLLAYVYFTQDDVSINILKNKDFAISPSDKALRAFYNQVKNNYKSPYGIEVQVSFVDIGSNELESKKKALKKYLSIKKGKSNFDTTTEYFTNSANITKDIFTKIASSNNKVLKPIKIGNKFAITKLNKIIKPKPLKYEQVKEAVKQRYIASFVKSKIDDKIQQLSKNFKGQHIGTISRGEKKYISGLDDKETAILIDEIFKSTSQVGFVRYADKTIVYKINKIEPVFFNKDNKQFKNIKQKLYSIKNYNIFNALNKHLSDKYKIYNYASAK